MRLPQYSDAAKQDLNDIWRYVAERSPDAADRLTTHLLQCCLNLNHQPWMGHRREDIASPDIRCWTEGWYVIAYVTDGVAIRVVRVVHGARDFTNLQFDLP